MTINFGLKRKIMLRIYSEYIFRNIKQPITAEILLFIFSATFLFFSVSISDVITNMPHDVNGFSSFAISAVGNTEITVQALILSIIIATGLLMRNLFYIYFSSRSSLQENS